ncbi:unnamed protein product [Prunus armeniaca]
MKLDEKEIQPNPSPIYTFEGMKVQPIGNVTLPVIVADMSGIDPEIACHRLNIDPNHPPYQQKQRRFAPQQNQIISDEVDRLLEAGFIREVWW